MHDFYINHTLKACKQNDAVQLKIWFDEIIYLEEYKIRDSCRNYNISQKFCQRWEKRKNESWKMNELKKYQYEQLIYDIMIELFQCSDSRYSMNLYTTIQKENNERYAHLSNENVAAWLCKNMTVIEVKCSEIIQQF